MSSNSYDPARNEYFEQFQGSHQGFARIFSVNPNSCGNPAHFKEYLLCNAMSDSLTGMGVTHVLAQHDDEGNPTAILGYVTLKTSSLLYRTESGYSGKPALEISELAVNRQFERQGIGRLLLDYALFCCREIQKSAGVMYLLVYAEPQAVEFYSRVLNFEKMGDLYEIPNEVWNANCVPMLLKFDMLASSKPVYPSEDDDEEDA